MTSYNIGLDFGTTNSTITFLDGTALQAFRYGGAAGEDYVPSFITYEDGLIEIGKAAKSTAANDPHIEAYGNFKMRLPIPDREFPQHFKGDRTPMSVTTDYLRKLLIDPDSDGSSFIREKGEIEKIVVSVPELWQNDLRNLGRERLQKIIAKELGLGDSLIQLVSEPVAAAAYYAYEAAQRIKNDEPPFTGNLLVCDMGGGTFDVSLCKVSGNNTVEVLYFNGKGDRDLDSAGVAFDRACVRLAYQKKHGEEIEDEDSQQFRRLLKDFEIIKIESHKKTVHKITNYFRDPDTYKNVSLYNFCGDYNLTHQEVEATFAPVSAGIESVMQEVKDWLQENNTDFDRLFLVGSFCKFPLVQYSILKTLGITENDPKIDRSFNTTDSAFAISYGACLIANGKIDPIEKYSHSIGITVSRQNIYEEVEPHDMQLIKAGTSLDCLIQPCFADEKMEIVTRDGSFSLNLWIQSPNKNNDRYRMSLPDTFQLPQWLSRGDLVGVGMRVDRSQIVYLVIEKSGTDLQKEYELGDIIAKVFVNGFIIASND